MPMVVRKVYQVVGFLLFMSTLFLVLSVSSYFPADPDWNHYDSHESSTVRAVRESIVLTSSGGRTHVSTAATAQIT